VITHPEKVLFPPEGDNPGITKGELASYYEAIAPVMLRHIRARPVTMERYNAGIGAPGFFQKDVSKGFPLWLERVEVPKKGGTVHHPLVSDTRSLLWLANQNCITPHVWTSRAPALYYPDICVFDLDPSNASSPEPGLRGDGIDEIGRVRDSSPLVVHQRRRTRFE
jgi:bifunctional non-homologous end joining protein LigD